MIKIKKLHIFYLIYLLFIFGFFVILSEMVARQVWKIKYADWLQLSVNQFGQIDREKLLERYKPGYNRTLKEVLDELKASGKELSYNQTKFYMEKYDLSPQSVAFRINQFGLKGPEVTQKPSRGVERIMTLGDSCTFGPHIDDLSYPRQLEKLLNKMQHGRFEVINAGHLGYNFQQIFIMLDEWLVLEPDIITILMGWNRTIHRADPNKNDNLYEISAIYRFYYHGFVNKADAAGVANLFTSKYNLRDPVLQDLKKKTFEVDINWLKRIIQKIRNQLPKSKIMLITLAGLYSTDIQPTAEDIKKGYAMPFTPNLAAWAVLSEQFNNKLRDFSIEQNLILLDLEDYANKVFHPRGDFYMDTVHPSPLGHRKIAEFIAEAIKNLPPEGVVKFTP